MRFDCPATVATLPDGSLACLDGVGAAVAWVVVPEWEISDLDVGQAGAAFGAAFVLVGMFWALGKGVGLVVNSIRRF